MAYVKAPIPSEVYHLTQMDKLDDILDDGKIRRFGDTECWFCESLAKMKAYMEQTVLCEGKPYYGAGGQLCRYPKFEPDEHIILKLTPSRREGNWYRWNQEIPLNSPPELVQAAAEFSKLKIGFRGDLPFRNAEAIDVAEFLHGSIVCRNVQTTSELWKRLSEKVEQNNGSSIKSRIERFHDLFSVCLIQTDDLCRPEKIAHASIVTPDFGCFHHRIGETGPSRIFRRHFC